MAVQYSLELPSGIKILSDNPIDPRMVTANLSDIENDPTYRVGFSPIYDEDTQKTYQVSGGDAVTGWQFSELSGGGASERENITSSVVSLEAQTTVVDFSDVKVLTVPFNDGITTHIIAVSGLSLTERYNTIVIDNSANNSGLNVTFNDQTGAIKYRGAKNDFPGIYPTMEVKAGTIWNVSFENRSDTLVEVSFDEVEDYV